MPLHFLSRWRRAGAAEIVERTRLRDGMVDLHHRLEKSVGDFVIVSREDNQAAVGFPALAYQLVDRLLEAPDVHLFHDLVFDVFHAAKPKR